MEIPKWFVETLQLRLQPLPRRSVSARRVNVVCLGFASALLLGAANSPAFQAQQAKPNDVSDQQNAKLPANEKFRSGNTRRDSSLIKGMILFPVRVSKSVAGRLPGGRKEGEVKANISYCNFNLERKWKIANLSFNSLYSFAVNKKGEVIDVEKIRDDFIGEDNVRECVTKWKIVGFPDNSKFSVYFVWQHGKGWVRQEISGNGFEKIMTMKGLGVEPRISLISPPNSANGISAEASKIGSLRVPNEPRERLPENKVIKTTMSVAALQRLRLVPISIEKRQPEKQSSGTNEPLDYFEVPRDDLVVRLRLVNDTGEPVYYLTGVSSDEPVGAMLSRKEGKIGWQSRTPSSGRRDEFKGDAYNWKLLPPGNTVEFEVLDLSAATEEHAVTVFVNNQPNHAHRVEIISSPYRPQLMGVEPSQSPRQSFVKRTSQQLQSVYIEFERSGTRTPLYASESNNGIWLRLHNNSKRPIALNMHGVPSSDYGDASLIYDVLSGNKVIIPGSCHACSLNSLGSGRSLLFSVPAEYLSTGRALRINYSYSGEDSNRVIGGLQPEHFVYFYASSLPPRNNIHKTTSGRENSIRQTSMQMSNVRHKRSSSQGEFQLIGRVIAQDAYLGLGKIDSTDVRGFIVKVDEAQTQGTSSRFIKIRYESYAQDKPLPPGLLNGENHTWSFSLRRDEKCDQRITQGIFERRSNSTDLPKAGAYILLHDGDRDLPEVNSLLSCFVLRPGGLKSVSSTP